jgi:hypothetical protein
VIIAHFRRHSHRFSPFSSRPENTGNSQLISWQKEMLKQRIATLSKLTIIGFAALVLAVLALLGAAFLTDNASLLIGTALIVLCVANFIAQYLLWNQRFTYTRIVAQGISLLVLSGLFYMAVLRPTAGESRTDLADVQFWDLVTGSRIAYIKLWLMCS